MTPLMVLAGGGKEDHGEQKEKKGCRMTKGSERRREVQPEVTGWGWEGWMGWPPPLLCVCKSMRATGEGKRYTQATSPAGYVIVTHRSNGDIINQLMPAANYGVNRVPLQVFTACFFTGTVS